MDAGTGMRDITWMQSMFSNGHQSPAWQPGGAAHASVWRVRELACFCS